MCNINILIRKKLKHNIKPFIHSVTSNSFINNNNGEGVYCDYENKVLKSSSKIDYTKIDNIDKSKIVLTHQRYTTSGYGDENIQPFNNNNFVMVHNGVLNHLLKDDKNSVLSDTAILFEKFNKLFEQKKTDIKNRKNVIVDIIKELFNDDYGTYSIFIYDKVTNKGYYFKDNSTRMNIYKVNGEYLYFSTNKDNQIFLNLLNKNDKEFKENKIIDYDITNRAIYEIDIKTLSLLIIGELKSNIKYYNNYHSFKSYNKKKKKKKDKYKKCYVYDNNNNRMDFDEYEQYLEFEKNQLNRNIKYY